MIDLTQPLSASTPRFPGDPEVRIEHLEGFAPWQISRVTMGSHSGTHMDAPRHLFPAGSVLADFDVSRFVGRGIVFDVRGTGENEPISIATLDDARERLVAGEFAFFLTGWDKFWGTDRYFNHPYLSRETAGELVSLGIGLVGIDTLSVDSTADGGSAAHEVLLGSGTLIVENLCNLDKLDPAQTYTFACLPLALADADGSPARVVAWPSG